MVFEISGIVPAPRGAVTGKTRVVDVIDKGAGKGALVYTERKVTDKASGELIATVTQTTFCRADGGFGVPVHGRGAGRTCVRTGDRQFCQPGCDQHERFVYAAGNIPP